MPSRQPGSAAAPPGAFTIKDAARELGVGRTTIYRMLDAKEIETFTVRGMRRVSAAEINRLRCPSTVAK